MDRTLEKKLVRLYTTAGLPSAFSSVTQLWKYAKKFKHSITKREIANWLSSRDEYTLHRLPRSLQPPRVVVQGIDEQWCADLCDMSNIARYNNNHNFMLTVIDVFSKKADAEPILNKSGKAVTQAFARILDRADSRIPQNLETDKGKEFWNDTFRKMCQSMNINHFSTQSVNKASVVERFNRSLKTLLYRYFTSNQTYTWLNALPKIMRTYNSRWHRSIKMSPNEVTNSNADVVKKSLYGKTRKMKQSLSTGSLVRISKTKLTFHKGYLPNYTEEIFKVYRVLNTQPPRYKLEDLMGERLIGSFSDDEIQRVDKKDADMWKIEKIIKRRKLRNKQLEYFVSWRGFPEKFNSWIKAKNLYQLNKNGT